MFLNTEQAREKYKGAVIKAGALIRAGAVIGAGAEIGTGVVIKAGAVIGTNRKNVTDALIINGLGSTKKMTAFISNDELIICIGCIGDYSGVSIDEAEKIIKEKYPDTKHPYYSALSLAISWYESIKQKV